MLQEVQKWFTLFFVPLSPIGSPVRMARCMRCAQMFRPPAGGPRVAMGYPAPGGVQPVIPLGQAGMPAGTAPAFDYAARPVPVEPPGERTIKWWGWALLGASLLILFIGVAGIGPMVTGILLAAASLITITLVTLVSRMSDRNKIIICSIVTAGCWLVALFFLAVFAGLEQGSKQTAMARMQASRAQAAANQFNNAKPPPGWASNGPSSNAPGSTPTVPPGPTPRANPNPATIQQTQIVGGSAGFMFQRTIGRTSNLIGFKWVTQTNMPGAADPSATGIKSLDLLTTAPPNAGDTSNPTRGFCVARDGYAVGGIEVDADSTVHAIRVTFMRCQDGKMIVNDQYQGPWIGTPTGNPTTTLAGDGSRVVGITGRSAHGLSSIGLMTTGSPGQ